MIENIGLSQPTISRAITEVGADIVRIGAARSIQYALRDRARGLPDIPVYRVDTAGQIRLLGTLSAVRPEGFVMSGANDLCQHSDGLPWWLFDMRPQGYLGRAYAARHAAPLGLPARLTDWSDTHALRALLAHGHDVVGNLLLGDLARERFLSAAAPEPIAEASKAGEYARLALSAAQGEQAGSSAGGEQPKFTCYAAAPDQPCHMIVKFTEREDSPVSERWRDLLLAEHLALETLRNAGIPAARTRIIEHDTQRFLEVERFDRIGPLGRQGLISLSALDAEFVGGGSSSWPDLTQHLAKGGHITREASERASLLWAFGTLIGNSDMHNGNLSFIAEQGRPHELAPAYDMTPMGFAPRNSGGLPDSLPEANIHASVSNERWRQAEMLARDFMSRLATSSGFSRRFGGCIEVLREHVQTAGGRIGRLG